MSYTYANPNMTELQTSNRYHLTNTSFPSLMNRTKREEIEKIPSVEILLATKISIGNFVMESAVSSHR